MKIRLLILLSLLYGLLTTGFSLYWSTNFTEYVYFKGDYFSVFAGTILALAYIFLLTIYLTVKKVFLILPLSLPIIASIVSFIFGLIIMLSIIITDNPKNDILIYGTTYELFIFLSIYIFWGRKLSTK